MSACELILFSCILMYLQPFKKIKVGRSKIQRGKTYFYKPEETDYNLIPDLGKGRGISTCAQSICFRNYRVIYVADGRSR